MTTQSPALVVFDAVTAAGRWLGRWPNGFIALWLVIQLAVPLHYYLMARDEHDERFAWRMFSPMRMLRCDLELSVGNRPVAVTSEFHDAWQQIAARGRRSVVSAMGRHLCRKSPGQPVVARLRCVPVAGEPYAVGGFDLCKIPEL